MKIKSYHSYRTISTVIENGTEQYPYHTCYTPNSCKALKKFYKIKASGKKVWYCGE